MRLLLFFIPLILITLPSFSQEENKKDKSPYHYVNNLDRKWGFELPLWVPGFRGQFAFGDISMSSTEESDKERERTSSQLGLEFYFVGRASFETDNWLISLDAFSGRINSKLKFDRILVDEQKTILDITIHGTIPRFYGGYTFFSRQFKKKGSDQVNRQLKLSGYIGFRYVDLVMNSVILDSVFTSSLRPSYFEPILGLFVTYHHNRWLISASGDFGAIDNKSSYMLNTQVQYRFGHLVYMKFGWNHLGLRHQKEYNGKNLNVDIVLTGPALGVGFRF